MLLRTRAHVFDWLAFATSWNVRSRGRGSTSNARQSSAAAEMVAGFAFAGRAFRQSQLRLLPALRSARGQSAWPQQADGPPARSIVP